jgi:endonuclease/exonuclease/phosphatase family metal-dependent hydrolase
MIQTNYRQPQMNSNSVVRRPQENGNSAVAAEPTDSVTLDVGTYNIKNWFAPEDANQELGKKPKPQRELEALADNITRSGVQVVAMQEVGTSRANVEKFFATHMNGEFKYLAMEETNDARGVHVIVASKFPISNVVTHTDARFPLADGTGDTKFSRDLLRADIDVKGTPFTIYTTHGKSRRTYAANDPAHPGGNNPDNQRIGEGRAIAEIVSKEMKEFPGRLYVVTGDLNDGTEDKSVQAIMNPSSGEKMFDTLEGLSEKERRTWPADPKAGHGHAPEQFDHILVPVSQRGKVVETKIIDIPGVSQVASDHLEVRTKFVLSK